VELIHNKIRYVYILGGLRNNMLGNILQAIATWSIISKLHGSTIEQDVKDALK
jgi:hypothetical protein